MGASAITIDAIARQAGVSKGGVLHYFSTKSAVLEALVSAAMATFESEVDRLASLDARGPGAWTRAYLKTSAGEGEVGGHAGYAVAWANEPSLLALVQARYQKWRERLFEDGLDPAVANLVAFAADGVWQADGLGLAPLRGPIRMALLERLEALTLAEGPR